MMNTALLACLLLLSQASPTPSPTATHHDSSIQNSGPAAVTETTINQTPEKYASPATEETSTADLETTPAYPAPELQDELEPLSSIAFPSWFVPTLLAKVNFEFPEVEPLLPEKKRGFQIDEIQVGSKGEFYENWAYRFKFDAAVDFDMLDFYVNYALSKGAQLRAGQFKVPYGRMEIASTGELATPSRALVSKMAPARDSGAMLHGNPTKWLGYAAGIFNGEGRNLARNINDNFLSAARLVVTAWGNRVDLSDAPYWQNRDGLSIGLNGYVNRDGDIQGTPVRAFGGDLSFYFGAIGLLAEWSRANLNPPSASGLDDYHTTGYYIQPMVEVMDGWEWVARYERFEPHSNFDIQGQQEQEGVWLGSNLYLKDGITSFKLAYGKVAEQEGVEYRNNTIIAQLQLRLE